MRWLAQAQDEGFHLSLLTLGELRHGAIKLGDDVKRKGLEKFIDGVIAFYDDRILPIDRAIAETWARLRFDLKGKGATIGAIDELIAATALANDLTVVTRDVRHFGPAGCKLVSPWTMDAD
ncbi:type II toxin-antitoxin system VapC family toxin [soil metagenome]